MNTLQALLERSTSWFHKISQILMMPVAVLPLAGLLLMAGDLLGRGGFTYAAIITNSGYALFEYFPLLIAVSLALNLAEGQAGGAAFAGAAAWLVLTRSGAAIYSLLGSAGDPLPFNMGVLSGLLAGCLAAAAHNRFRQTRLPAWLSFFEGRRLVPILAGLAAILPGAACGLIWHFLQVGLAAVASRLTTAAAGGAFAYGFLNRLLLPIGLHHVLNQEIWFQTGEFTSQSGFLIFGDLNRFFAGDPTAGRYIAGFFPMMIFGIPAIALCFSLTARRRNRSRIIALMAITGLVSLVSGVTEPIEYLFLFISPLLYLLYSLLYGLSQLICYQLHVLEGFTFSAGLTDYLANWDLATHPEYIWQVGILMALLSFAVFYFAVTLLKLRAPGRDKPDEDADKPEEESITKNLAGHTINATGIGETAAYEMADETAVETNGQAVADTAGETAVEITAEAAGEAASVAVETGESETTAAADGESAAGSTAADQTQPADRKNL